MNRQIEDPACAAGERKRCAALACAFDASTAQSRRRVRYERIQQLVHRFGHLVDGSLELHLVRLGRPGKAAQFADELQRRGPDLVGCGGRFEIM
jgi:hypothetical protein